MGLRVLVTGATGFVGRHLIPALLARGHGLTAVARDLQRARAFGWFSAVNFVAADVHAPAGNLCEKFGPADVVVHLAWPGLPNYRQEFHVSENLPRDFAFLDALVQQGYRRLLVTGTCLECSPREGCCSETDEGEPTLPYPLAKLRLRHMLVELQRQRPFDLQWARLFYMYGQGQSPNSLLSQLDRAIDGGAASFDMSGGEQERDFLPVTEVAAKLVKLVEHPEWTGVSHVCSGEPITVRALVERRLAERGAKLKLNLGVYPYPDYEPMSFWGASDRL